ncbi:restriction endonuclease subunit S [Citricoccus nitrophenolicus]
MKIGDILSEFKAKPPVGEDPEVLTLTERNGFVRQSERFNKRLATEDVSNYKFIGRDDFAFNPYLLWAGALARNDRFGAGVISPLYPTFQVKSGFDPAYVIRILLADSSIKRYDSIAFGSVPRRRRSSVKDFLGLGIPSLPPLAEQRRIADILDKADALRAKRREAIAHLDALNQSIFHEMFGNPVQNERGWRKDTLSSLLSGIDSGKSPVCSDRPANEGEGGLLKLSAVTSGRWLPRENKAFKDASSDPRHAVGIGDVLFTRKNTPSLVAAVARVDALPLPLFMPDLIFRLRVRDERVLESGFLAAVLQNGSQRQSIQRLASGSAQSMVNISKAKLSGVSIPVPPLDLQQEFKARVSAVEHLKATQRTQLDELDNLFLSLQDRAFKGELS